MFIENILFPKFCVGCGFLGCYICLECEKELSRFSNAKCLYCTKSSPFGLTHHSCKKKDGVDGFLSLYHYNDFLKKVIKNIKYRLATEVWRSLQAAIKPEILYPLLFYKRLQKEFFIQPIPLHKQKLRERGFNQAQLMANFLNRFLHYSVVKLLVRKKATLAQAEINRRGERYRNMKGAFCKAEGVAIEGKSLILVDDVVTTGMTMREAARTLKQNGAREVFALSLAKG